MLTLIEEKGTRKKHGLRVVRKYGPEDQPRFLKDDPVGDFGKPGAHHQNLFIGNLSGNAFSTPQSLAEKPTSDLGPEGQFPELAWMPPPLLPDGTPAKLLSTAIYYKSYHEDFDHVQPFSQGFAMVSRDGKIDWKLDGRLILKVTFPEELPQYPGAIFPRLRVESRWYIPRGTNWNFAMTTPKPRDKALHAGYMAAAGTEELHEQIARACRPDEHGERRLLRFA